MRLRVLGPMELLVGGRPVDLGPAKQRAVLAALLLEADHPVGTSALIDRVWDEPPAGARSGLHSYITRLRRILEQAGEGPPRLLHGREGYRVELGAASLDLHRFRRLVEDARAYAGDEQRAVALREAVGLWQGEPLDGLPGEWLGRQRDLLQQQRLDTVLWWTEVELRLRRPVAVLEPLRAMVERHPLVEPLVARLIEALCQAGRGAEALDRFARTRARLVEELGTEPGAELGQLHEAILRGELPAAAASGPPGPVPAQLPAVVAGFTGRAEQLRRLAEPTPAGAALPVTVIAGVGGVGKTALAVSWAHRIGDRFPDGQLFVDLRGFDLGAPVRPVAALAGFLRALGMPADQVPVEEAEAAAAYRSLLAGRRVLVVLDNATDAQQVRPLLPGDPRCQVVVTSRDSMAGLAAVDGADRLTLDVLPAGEAVDLLRAVIGSGPVDAEPAAVSELARRCGYLPLALRIAAAQIVDARDGGARDGGAVAGRPVAAYLDRLLAAGTLATLEIGADPRASVRATLIASYRRLTEPERRLFRLVGLVPGTDLSEAAAAALAAVPLATAGAILRRLATVHLLAPAGAGRYRMHDLVRLYAAELATADAVGAGDDPLGRLLDWYLRCGHAVADLLYPHLVRLAAPEAAPGRGSAVPFADPAGAVAWLDAERANLVATVRYAADHGPAALAWRLADVLRGYFQQSRHMLDWLHVTEAGLGAAVGASDARAQAAMHLGLGAAHGCLDHVPAVIEHHQVAAELARRAGWVDAQAASMSNLGIGYVLGGDLPVALDCQTTALALYRRAGRPGGVAMALGNLGGVYHALGRLEEAVACAAEALDAVRTAGGPSGEANALENLGFLELASGRLAPAREHIEQALVVGRAAGNRYIEARARCSLARVEHESGRLAEAAVEAEAAVALADEVGENRTRADAHTVLGDVTLSLGRPEVAAGAYAAAIRIADSDASRYERLTALVGSAYAHQARSAAGAATAAASEALEAAGKAGYRLLEGKALTALATIQAAPDLARQALAVHRETGDRLAEARTLRLLARLLGAEVP
jgi:DNA-binding SARP family transcriptional activator/tetratricopeptide (TPR) repeat protein